jgi:hypothetical protein
LNSGWSGVGFSIKLEETNRRGGKMKRIWIRFDSMKEETKAVQRMAGKVPILGRRVKDYAIAPEHLPFIESLGVLFYITGREGIDEASADAPIWLTARGGARPPSGGAKE